MPIRSAKKPHFIFIILLIAAYFPLTVGIEIPVIRTMLIVEWLPLLIFADIALFWRYKPSIGRLYFIAISALMVALLFSYIRFPVSSVGLLGASEEERGLRVYYDVIVYLALFYVLYAFVRKYNFNYSYIMNILVYFTLITSLIAFICRLLMMDNPMFFLVGGFDYMKEHFRPLTESAGRPGGLDIALPVGIAALIAKNKGIRFNLSDSIIFMILISLVLLSGGRGLTIGVLFTIIFFIIATKSNISAYFKFLIIGMFAISIMSVAMPDVYQNQITRITGGLTGDLQQDASRRYYNIQTSLYYFKNNPLMGKGISPSDPSIDVTGDLRGTGGHTGYMTVPALFGILGFFWLSIFIFYTLLINIKLLRMKGNKMKELYMFTMVYLSINAVILLVSGNAFASSWVYATAGLVLGAKTNLKIINKHDKSRYT
jgi:hypothetical protein